MSVSWPSLGSIWLSAHVDHETPLGTATGFVVCRHDRHYLITNRHVVSGRHWGTNETIDPRALVPRYLDLRVNTTDQPTAAIMWGAKHVEVSTPADDGFDVPRWYEHPRYGSHVDVAALPLDLKPHEAVHVVHDPERTSPLPLGVASELYIVGFPYGRPYGGFMSTWVRGSIASEPSLSFRGSLPVFAIDARTRKGMSGSPVVSALISYQQSADGETIERVFDPYLVGVYSGRLTADSDIGLVWHKSVITDIIDGAYSPDPMEAARTRPNRW